MKFLFFHKYAEHFIGLHKIMYYKLLFVSPKEIQFRFAGFPRAITFSHQHPTDVKNLKHTILDH